MSIWQYFSVFLTLDLLPFFFFVSSLPCRFFPPNNQQTTEGSIHTSIHLRRFDVLRSRYHRNVDGTLLAANSNGRCRQLVEREGFIRGVWVGIWKLMSWMSRNICFFEFLNPFIFLLRKMTSFVSRIQKKQGWKNDGRHPESLRMGHFFFSIWSNLPVKFGNSAQPAKASSWNWTFYGKRCAPAQKVWRYMGHSGVSEEWGTQHAWVFLQQTHQSLLDSEVWKFQTHPTEICWGSLTTVPNKFHDHSIFFGPTLFVEAHGIPVKNHTNTSGPD